MAFDFQRTEAVTFLVDGRTMYVFPAGEEECFYCMDSLFVSGHLSRVTKRSSKLAEFASNM